MTHDNAVPTRLISIRDSFEKIRSRDDQSPRLAFVSVLPPEKTGVAAFSMLSIKGYDHPLDVFSPIREADSYYCICAKLEGTNCMCVLDVGAIGFALNKTEYSAIIIAIGNSPHHYYVFDVLRKIEAMGLSSRVVLYLHDICLLSLLYDCFGLPPGRFAEMMSGLYGEQYTGASSDKWFAIHGLVDQNIFGLRFFLKEYGIGRFLINSSAAAELVAHDLRDCCPEIEQVFLPVEMSPHLGPPNRNPAKITIGSFGVPGGEKRTSEIVAAVAQLAARGLPVVLLLAGFGCAAWSEAHASELKGVDLIVVDSPSDWRLRELMASVDVAVQLRRRNLGESSGAVTELIALRKSVIVTRIGSFLDFGDAVRQLDSGAAAEDIADCILELIREPISPLALESYAASHSPKRFQEIVRGLYAPSVDKNNQPSGLSRDVMMPWGRGRSTS